MQAEYDYEKNYMCYYIDVGDYTGSVRIERNSSISAYNAARSASILSLARPDEYVPNLKPITKIENRRSKKKIVDLANKIRNDCIKQVPILNADGTNENYIIYDENNLEESIQQIINKIGADEAIDVLVLKNELVAEKSGFGCYYSILGKETLYYRQHYEQIASEIMSDDITKLGVAPSLFYKIVKLYYLIKDNSLRITEYIPQTVYKDLSLKKLSIIRNKLDSIKPDSLKTWAESIYEFCKDDPFIKNIIAFNIGESFNSFTDIKNYVYESLFNNVNDEESDNALTIVDKLFDIDFNIYISLYEYLIGKTKNRIRYHTFHSTKGLEYDNVILAITNSFYRKNDYFHSYFKDLSNLENNPDFDYKKNLLYVAVTRAKNSLYTIYVDDRYDDIKTNFESIFGPTIFLDF